MKLKNLKINVLGDSITEGYGTSDLKYVYWKLLESEDGAIVYGDGIGGSRIAHQAKPTEENWDKFFRSRLKNMPAEADLIVVLGGTNDYGHGDAPIGTMEDRTDDTFYGALHLLYTDLINMYPKAKIIAMTPLHRLEEERYVNEIGIRNVGTLADYVEVVKEVAEYYGIKVVDLYGESGMQPAVPVLQETFMPDGLHPNDAGHRKIYEMLKSAIEVL